MTIKITKVTEKYYTIYTLYTIRTWVRAKYGTKINVVLFKFILFD